MVKADEAYQIGEAGHPVRAYLSVEEIIRAAPQGRRGRGLPGIRLPVREPGSSPRPASRPAWSSSGRRNACWTSPATSPARWPLPVTPACPCCAPAAPSDDAATLLAAAEDVGFPLFVKAVAGGGGRGMRRVADPAELGRGASSPRCARPSRPSATATVFLEQAVDRPAAHRGADPRRLDRRGGPPVRAGLLGAAAAPEGRRDRARHRTSTPRCVQRMCADAVAFARQIGYVNAGTVEFLVDARGQLRVHRDEPAHPGRAHGDRGGHRRGPGDRPAAHRGRRHARASWA